MRLNKYICDRCGKEALTAPKYYGPVDSSEKPDGWRMADVGFSSNRLLCDECYKEYESIRKEYKKRIMDFMKSKILEKEKDDNKK